MLERWRNSLQMVWLVAWRELRDQLRDWRIIIPMFILTAILPFLANAGARAAMNFASQYGTPLIAERLVPFLLLVVGFFPVTVSLVIALEAFVGEKERGTIEPLLVSPLEDWQIYMGKLLAGTVAPLITSYLGIGFYLIGLLFQNIPIPDPTRMAQTLTLTTVQAFLMVSGAILISTQSTSVRAANLMSSFIVIPMALLIQGEAVMLFWGNDQVLWLAVTGVAVLTVLLARVGVAHFQREALLGREIDILNLRWVGQTFWHAFKGQATSLGQWYRLEVRAALRRQTPIILIVAVIGLLSMAGGYFLIHSNLHTIPSEAMNEFGGILPVGVDIPLLDSFSFFYILGHNLRSVVFIFLAGLFSFGTLGVLLYVLNTAVIGGLISMMDLMGLPVWKMAVFGILPHGIFEIPALVLSSAAVLYVAVMLVTPQSNRSLGEAAIEALAECARLFVGVILPLFALAAALETWVTPALLSRFGG